MNQLIKNKKKIQQSMSLCFYCETEDGVTIDHKIPQSRGGSHGLNNLVPCCKTCNEEKGNAISSEVFKRYTRRFGKVSKGWRKTTNKYKINAIKKTLRNLGCSNNDLLNKAINKSIKVIKNKDGVVIWQGDETLVGIRLWLYCKQFPDEFFRVESVPLE